MSQRTCSVESCDRLIDGLGLCNAHYQRWIRFGDVLADKPFQRRYSSPDEALAERTEWRGECLVWTGHTNDTDYGVLRVRGRAVRAHRFAWERAYGPIPAGSQIDHKCWTPACVRLEHLRVATPAENSAYRSGPQAKGTASGIRNVHKLGARWAVIMQRQGRRHYYGTFDTVAEAAVVAERARQEVFGEWAGRG